METIDEQPSSCMSDRTVSVLIIAVIGLGLVWTLFFRAPPPASLPSGGSSQPVTVISGTIPLVTGEEPIEVIFTRAGCPVCHTIPGVGGANGTVGPPLILARTGAARLNDPSYHGAATTVSEYIAESIMDPGIFVVPGYPSATMPTWYGTKLSALALEKIVMYLEQQTGEAGVSVR